MATILVWPASVTVQVFAEVEVHPVQLAKVEPLAGVAVRTILSPIVNCAPQAWPGQLMPAGELTTAPVPFPAGVTISAAFVELPPGHSETFGSFTVTLE